MLVSVTIGAGRIVLDKRLLRQTMRSAGQEVAALARAMIRSGDKNRPSVPGGPPVSRTGNLARNIKVKAFRSGEGVTIRDVAAKDGAFYALFLEKGAKGGGGNTRNKANILPAGQIGRNGKLLRGRNRMKASVISKVRVLAPRPFLSVALAQREASISQRVAASINQGIKFERIKA